jgi:hypothetical protein
VAEGLGTSEGVAALEPVALAVAVRVGDCVGVPEGLAGALRVAKREREAPACEGEAQGDAVSVSLGDTEVDREAVELTVGVAEAVCVAVTLSEGVAEAQGLAAAVGEGCAETELAAVALAAPEAVGATLEALGQGEADCVAERLAPAARLGVLPGCSEGEAEGQAVGEGEREGEGVTLEEEEMVML